MIDPHFYVPFSMSSEIRPRSASNNSTAFLLTLFDTTQVLKPIKIAPASSIDQLLHDTSHAELEAEQRISR